MRKLYILEDKYDKLVSLPEVLSGCVEGIYSYEDARLFEAADAEGFIPEGLFSYEELESAYRRAVLNKETADSDTRYYVNDFYSKMDFITECNMEVFDEMSPENAEKVKFHMMDPEVWLPILKSGSEKSGIYPEILPLEVIRKRFEDAEGHFYAFRCNCNAYIGGCSDRRDKSKVCLHSKVNVPGINTMADRGAVQEISKEELIRHLEEADRMGLVHKGHTQNGEVDTCDCCTCCCIHFGNINEYEMKGDVIKTDYVITVDEDNCIGCGACEDACPFGALELGDAIISASSSKCWGCGVCRNACTQDALVIKKR